MNYRTYAEAKIANPDSEIVTTGEKWNGEKFLVGSFAAATIESFGDFPLGSSAWIFCNPADYCSSLKEFIGHGFKLVAGDKVITIGGGVFGIKDKNTGYNNSCKDDHKRYILSASALNGDCKIPAKAEQWSVYNNTLPLCELTDEQRGLLVNYLFSNGDTDVFNGEVWLDMLPGFNLINREFIYRAKQKSGRELFIEAAIGHGIKPETQSPKQIFGELFDSGKFKYIDNTQHFGENI